MENEETLYEKRTFAPVDERISNKPVETIFLLKDVERAVKDLKKSIGFFECAKEGEKCMRCTLLDDVDEIFGKELSKKQEARHSSQA